MSVERLPSGLYRVRIADRGVRGTAGTRRVTIGVYPTKKLAKTALVKAIEKRDAGARFVPDRVTLNDLGDRHIAACRERGLSDTTTHRYQQLWDSYIRDRIGETRVADLSPLQLETYYAQLMRAGGTTRRGRAKNAAPGKPRPLAPRTVGHVHGLLQATLNWALRLELVSRNPAAVARPPAGSRRPGKAFEEHEVDALLDTAERYRIGPLIAFVLETGLRRGELAGLRWDDVDLGRAVATIRGAIAQVPGRTWYKSTKQDSVKGVALSTAAIAALRTQKLRQAAERLFGGVAYRDEGFVFAPPLGGYPSPGSLGNAVRRVAKRAGLELTKLHAARHTTATVLLRQGEDLATVAAVLRHSSSSTTLATYAHEVVGAQRAAVDRAADERAARRARRKALERGA